MAAKDDFPQCQPLELVEAMARLSRVIESRTAEDSLLEGILDQVLDIFDADRAWLLRPHRDDPEVWQALAERTRPEWPGIHQTGQDMRPDAYWSGVIARCLASRHPVADIHADRQNPLVARFGIRSQLMLALTPRGRRTMLLGIHHCRRACTYDLAGGLFSAVAARVADALAMLRATSELRHSEDRFRRLVESAPEAIVLLDAEAMRFMDVNPAAEALYALGRAELLDGLGPADLSPEIQPDGRPSAQAARVWVDRAAAGEPTVFEWLHRRADGSDVLCEVNLVRLPHAERTLLRGSMQDIDARKRQERERAELQAQLAQAQKLEAIGQLTGGVAHDFNNLLTVIVGNVELAQQFPDDGELVADALEQVRTASERASALTRRLLAFSRRQPLRPRSLDMGDLLRGMDDLLRRTLGEQVDLELAVSGGMWRAEADPSQLENAVLNLCLNARDAMPGGGRLTIEAGNAFLDDEYAARHGEVEPGQYVVVSVTDDGTGMAPDVLANVFEPFFTTKDVGKGSGLGLSQVYGFVKQSGGHVKVYSEPDEGTTVKLYLRRADEDVPAPRAQPAADEMPRGGGETILVVEDAPDVRHLAEVILTRLGYRVLVAGDAASALAVLDGTPDVDLLFTDVVLPGGRNGAELAADARRARPGLKVLFTSGYTANAIIHNGRLDRGVRLVEKPFTRATIARRVREALDAPADAG